MAQAIPRDELELWIENKRNESTEHPEEYEIREELLDDLEQLMDDVEFEAFDLDNPPEPPIP